MKIVVVGGGRVGRQLRARLNTVGLRCVLATPRTGVDAYSGGGLDKALSRADVVIDATNSPFLDEANATRFFQTTTANLLAAGHRAGVGHHVLISFLGADRVPGLGYCRAKLSQEQLVRTGSVPHTIVRSTHTFEFLDALFALNTDDCRSTLPPIRVQPLAAADLAVVLVEAAIQHPQSALCEVAGPDEMGLDEMAKQMAGAGDTPVEVVTDPAARPLFGAEVDERALLPHLHARLTSTRLAQWLTSRTTR